MTSDLIPIRRALFSVTKKRGLTDFAQELRKIVPDVDIIASGGTAKVLAEKGISYTPLDKFTGFPECFGGRVKTLHPKVFGGILMRRGVDDDEAAKLGVESIDLIVCNLYDFKEASIDEMMESMDIGGSALIRSACKNYSDVAIVVDPSDYPILLHELKKHGGAISQATRERFAVKGINASADYESLLARVLTKRLANEETQRPNLTNGVKLRYGENPDQKAWVYHFDTSNGVANAKPLGGKELSYNNYEDATVAYFAAQGLLEIHAVNGVAIIKHGSLCAYATGNTLPQAFRLAWEGDSKSAFGSVIACTSRIASEMIPEMKKKFIEVLIAPEFSKDFIEWAEREKPKLRLLEIPNRCGQNLTYKNISGGMLVQTRKEHLIPQGFDQIFLAQPTGEKLKIGVMTKARPTPEKCGLFAFGIAAVNFAKSNAVAVVREPEPGAYQLIGMGAGQPNRVDSLERLAVPKAVENLQIEHDCNPNYDPKVDLGKCVIASDGFFPFDDSIHYAANAGFKYCVQPGGSIRDQEVINAADTHGMCMVFTGERYFYH